MIEKHQPIWAWTHCHHGHTLDEWVGKFGHFSDKFLAHLLATIWKYVGWVMEKIVWRRRKRRPIRVAPSY
jgi:hypothetical protein